MARSLALSFLVGGLSADIYFFTVFLAIPKVREMALRDRPCSLAYCTASQRACWVAVGRPVQLVAKRFLLTFPASGGYTADVGVVLIGRCQGGQKGLLSHVQVADGRAVGDLFRFGIRGAAGARSPQRRGGRWPLLKVNDLSLVPQHQLPVGPFQDVHPETGVVGPFCLWQQLEHPPLVLHGVVPGHLAGVL